VAIREATAADREAIEAIVAAAYAKWPPLIGVRPKPMDEDYGEVLARGDVWVAEREGEAVGVLVLVAEPDHLLIENVAVDPAHQGEGVGRELLAHAEAEGRRRTIVALRLFTNEHMAENIALYARLGYRKTRRGDESGFARVFMEKIL
jgi:ribosomal protein S18 acetylase RimI-like enzyme